MGALHEGHAELIRLARKSVGRSGTVVVSIFVNPLQFAPTEDLAAYPRPLAADQKLCRTLGVDILFLPKAESIIPSSSSVFVDEDGRLSSVLCGKSRHGHFRGVCTIVAKLFNIIQPDVAVFGEKDWQQLAIIRQMTRDLDFPLQIVACPVVRESDGLALSSRNKYLSSEERAVAPRFHAALTQAAQRRSPSGIRNEAIRLITKIPGARIDYVEVVDSDSLQAVKNLTCGATLAAAVFLGKTRLIDNIQIAPATR